MAVCVFRRFCAHVTFIVRASWTGSLARFVVMALLASALAVSNVAAQTTTQSASSTNIPRDAAAVATVNQSLKAMGGAAAFTALKDTRMEASCTRVSKAKTDTHFVRWTTAGDYFRFDGGDNDHRGMMNGPHGAMREMDGKTAPVNDRSLRAVKQIHFPGLLLFTILNRSEDAIEMLKSEDVGGVQAIHVRITDTRASQNTTEPQQEDWYFDPTTSLPLKLTYSVPALNSLFMYVRTTVEYSNYVATNSFMVPTTMRRRLEGGPITTCTVSSFSINNNPDPSVFSPSNGGGK